MTSSCFPIVICKSINNFLFEKKLSQGKTNGMNFHKVEFSIESRFRSFISDVTTTRKLISFRKYLFPFSIARQTREETDFREKVPF